MAFPTLRPKKKKRVEDDNEYEDEKPVFVPSTKAAKLPILQNISDDDITDEEVVEQIEQAINTASSFGRTVPTIRQHLRNRDYGSAAISSKGALLATLTELIPVAEMAVRESKAQRGIYQFNSLVSQMRELLIDLEGDRDLDGLVMAICNEAIEPKLRMLGQMLVQWNSGVKRELRTYLTGDDYSDAAATIDEQTQQLAMYISQMATAIQTDIERKVTKLND